MMRLVCNGVALDLKSGATLSFKKVNPLFAFDSLSCERTQAFDIPATPKNEAVFRLAKLPAFYGEGMRKRFDCELQSGTVVKRGYLYVDEFDGSYKGIFVTGELLGLLKIRDAGKIADFLVTSDVTEWGNPITSSDAFALVPAWRSVMYEETFPHAIPFPSYNLSQIIFKCFDQLGLQRPALPQPTLMSYNARVIPDKIKGIDTKIEVISSPVANSGEADPINALQFSRQYFDEDVFEISNGLTGVCAEFEADDLLDRPTVVRFLRVDPEQSPRTVRTIKCLRARYDCDIIFDANAPALNIFFEDIETYPRDFAQLYQIEGHDSGWYVRGSMYTSYTLEVISPGRYRSTYNLIRIGGAPVAGHSFRLTAGTRFAFIDPSDLSSDKAYDWQLGRQDDVYYTLSYDGGKNYFVDGQKGYSVTFSVKSEDPTAGGNVILQPNLPAITLVEACKTIAHMTGTALNYSDAGGLTFERMDDAGTWPVIDVSRKVLSVGSMSRRFADYARHNIVRFDSSGVVYYFERMREDYSVQNDNISESADLYIIPFSEGGIGASEFTTLQPALIRDAEEQGGDKSTIVCAADDDTNLGRVSLVKNTFIQNVCDASTSVNIRVRMTLAEYESIKAKAKILYNGTLYVWTEATWQNDTCSIKISKI